jgi:hypothetical protein
MCSLRFDIEENRTIEDFIRFRFASVGITTVNYGILAHTEHAPKNFLLMLSMGRCFFTACSACVDIFLSNAHCA